MKAGVNIGFGDLIGSAGLTRCELFGVELARQDVHPTNDLAPYVQEFVGRKVRPIFLLHDVARAEPLLDVALPTLGAGGFDIEIFNEPPGMDRVNQTEYVQGINAVHHDARARGFTGRIISGALANLGRDNIAWYRACWPQLPADVTLGFHRYSYKTQTDRLRPWPLFSSREDEIAKLRTIGDGRDLAVTEFGYHTAEETEGFWIFSKPTRLTDEQCRDYLTLDLRLYAANGVVYAIVYQARDGNTDDYLGRYGTLYDQNGSAKPQAMAFAFWREA